MPHVTELHPVSHLAAAVALAAAVLAGCTDTQRKVPLMAVPGTHEIKRVAVPQPAAVPGTAAGAFDAAVRSDALPPAATGVSIGASRRA